MFFLKVKVIFYIFLYQIKFIMFNLIISLNYFIILIFKSPIPILFDVLIRYSFNVFIQVFHLNT